MISTRGRLLIAGCASLFILADPHVAGATPRLDQSDLFLFFSPGFKGYDRDRGNLKDTEVFRNFGATVTGVSPDLDTAVLAGDHYEVPDVKYRVRINLSGAVLPFGTVEISGELYEWNGSDDPGGEVFQGTVSQILDVDGGGTFTTSTYFDKITSISTTGLGTDVTLTVSWWDGHEQEMSIFTTIQDITESQCSADDYLVHFNGQIATPHWNPEFESCGASLLTGSAAQRGMYFWMDPVWEDDAYFRFDFSGHAVTPSTLDDWLMDVPGGETYFTEVGALDPLIRPITIELERQSDFSIIDRARVLLWIAKDEFGRPVLKEMETDTVSPGAFSQLSPRGLDNLQPTHVVTLPYPLVDPGTQPRLSGTAIGMSAHNSDPAQVNLSELEDVEYWTEKNDKDPQFAGFEAYRDILTAAKVIKVEYDAALKACNNVPPILVPVCKAGVETTFCVKDDPKTKDFRVQVAEVETFYEPGRPLDALVIGDYRDLDLAFGIDQVTAMFTLQDIAGRLRGVIDPSDVRIVWDSALLATCTIKPRARTLSDFLEDTEDRENWLTCPDLGFAAGSGTLTSPIPFDLAIKDERFHTPYSQPAPQVTFQDVTASLGDDVCSENWMSQVMEDVLLGWETATGTAIEQDLQATPGEDEALNRLLSPFELGVERVDAPPRGTPPYEVQPLATYSLSAIIGATASDPVGPNADAVDGLHLPYLTQSVPTDGLPFYYWLCPAIGGQACSGLSGQHDDRFLAGLDFAGEPYDVLLSLSTAFINHALWAQAARPDRLGSRNRPVTLPVSTTTVRETANDLGYTELVDALDAAGTKFEIRYFEDSVPFARVTDDPPKLFYVVPNVIVELWADATEGGTVRIAKLLIDFIDRDFNLQFRLGGAPGLAGAWRDPVIVAMTSEFIENCYDLKSIQMSCDDQLRDVIGRLLTPVVLPQLMDMITMAPAPQLFDSGQESVEPRHLTNVRTYYSEQSVHLFGNICDPRFIWCP